MVAELGEHSSQETLIHVGLQLTWEKERITDVREQDDPNNCYPKARGVVCITHKARSTLQSWHQTLCMARKGLGTQLHLSTWNDGVTNRIHRCHGNGSHQVSVPLPTAYSKSLLYATLPQIFTYKCVLSISMTSCCMTVTVHVVLSFLCVTLRESARDGHSGTCCSQSFNQGHNL